MNTFSLKVIACDRVFFDGRCKQVILPLEDGQKAIQAHHENMAFAVEVGEIRIQEENGNWIYGVTGTGFAQIMNNRATVIVDTCESPEDIDVRPCERGKRACRGTAQTKTEYSGILPFQSVPRESDGATESQQPRQTDRLLKSSSKRQPFWLSFFASGWYNRKSE